MKGNATHTRYPTTWYQERLAYARWMIERIERRYAVRLLLHELGACDNDELLVAMKSVDHNLEVIDEELAADYDYDYTL